MKPLTRLLNLAGIIALMFVVSCDMNEEGKACSSDSECPPSYYCAQSGGVFFSSSQCIKSANQSTTDDADALDKDSSTTHDTANPSTDVPPDADSTSDTDSTSDADISLPPECAINPDCDDNVSCTNDTCVNGQCQNTPDDTQCDDNNACTDNRCDTVIGCVDDNNNAPCDDGVFCNGADLCADGACTFHKGTTCPGGICNEALNNCTQCSNDNECGEAGAPVVTTCAFASVCESHGTRNVTTRTPRCENNTCIMVETHFPEGCTRTMPTGSCGTELKPPFGICSFGENLCTTTGTQSRTITTPTCSNNSCDQVQTVENKSCTRNEHIGACKAESTGWTQCEFLNDCSNSALQYKTITSWNCNGGDCVSMTLTTNQSKTCTRNTQGRVCTSPEGNSGACINGCCDAPCPHGQHCLTCIALE